MDKHSFERLIKEKIQRESLRATPPDWEKISARLPEKSGRKIVFFLSPAFKIAAAILLLVGLGIGGVFLFKNTTTADQPAIVEQKPIIQDNENPITQKQNNNLLANEAPSVPNTKNNTTHHTTPIASTQKSTVNTSGRQEVSKVEESLPSQNPTSLFNEKEYKSVPSITKQGFNSSEQSLITGGYQLQKDPPGYLHQTSSDNHFYSNDKQDQNTSLLFEGGMNYGSLNGGYNLGVGVKQKITKGLFFEGSVGLLYNNQPGDVTSFNKPSTRAGRSSANGASQTPTISSVYDFYYVRVNPAIGYRISDFMSVSAGADFQQRVGGAAFTSTTILSVNTDPKIIPKLDVGLTAKTDFTLTEQIEAGLLYRNGVNNIVQPGNVYPYLDKRYIQVQLKYNLPL